MSCATWCNLWPAQRTRTKPPVGLTLADVSRRCSETFALRMGPHHDYRGLL